MSKRNYTHIQELLPGIKEMIAGGKSQREVAEHFGFMGKHVIKELLKRECRKQRKEAAGTIHQETGVWGHCFFLGNKKAEGYYRKIHIYMLQ